MSKSPIFIVLDKDRLEKAKSNLTVFPAGTGAARADLWK